MMFALLAMAMAAPAAQAPKPEPRREVELGSRLAKRVQTSDRKPAEVRLVQKNFGDCVIKKQAAAASHFVLVADLDKADWRKSVSKIADGACLLAVAAASDGVEMTFPGDTMRYALADALVRQEFRSAPAPGIELAAPLIQPKFDESEYEPKPGKKTNAKQLTAMADSRLKRIGVVYLAEYGECVVRKNPSQSHALLMADPDSVQEGAAFRAVTSALGECLTAGQSLSFNRMTLRGAIAMNYYRLAHAPRQLPAQIKANN